METGSTGGDDAIGNSRVSGSTNLSSLILRSFVLADLLLMVRIRERLALGDILISSKMAIATARDSREQASGLAEIAPSDASHGQDREFGRKFGQHASGEIERGRVRKMFCRTSSDALPVNASRPLNGRNISGNAVTINDRRFSALPTKIKLF